PRSPAAEAYRTLRTNIQFSSVDNPPRTLLVTGTEADEDSSIVLCNLAITIAQGGSRVIVADCDLRRPSVHEIFDLANDKGITTALLQEKGEGIPLQQTAVSNLQLLAAGPLPPNPADLLGSQKMRRVIDDLVAAADLVLFGAPPVGLFSDTPVLASRVDGTILVISAGKTRREAANRAKAILEKANARVLGVVLSNARLDSSLYRYYSSRGQ
ncbi:MAG: CpsD/CapB family tyrosine-protein kinase, partial [Chloroflexota bacterium]